MTMFLTLPTSNDPLVDSPTYCCMYLFHIFISHQLYVSLFGFFYHFLLLHSLLFFSSRIVCEIKHFISISTAITLVCVTVSVVIIVDKHELLTVNLILNMNESANNTYPQLYFYISHVLLMFVRHGVAFVYQLI